MRASSDGQLLYANAPAKELLRSMGSGGRELAEALRLGVQQVPHTGVLQIEVAAPGGAVQLFTLSRSAGVPQVNLYGRDITGLKRARREEARLAAIVESSDDAILSKDLEGTILSWNASAERLFGYTAREIIGKRVTTLVPPERQGEQEEILRRLCQGGRVERFDTQRVTKNGKLIDVSVTVSPLHDGHGKVIGASNIARDISERKRAEQILVDENRRKAEFLGVLSHELRNPLAPIRNSLYILSHAAPGGEQARRAHTVIARQVEHLSRLVDDLLDVTRISRGKIRLQRERVDLVSVARGTVEDHRDLFAKNGIDLEFVARNTPVSVVADPTRVAQMIGNLLQNAAKFTRTRRSSRHGEGARRSLSTRLAASAS
jgi:PAS domain S-box-containing protein